MDREHGCFCELAPLYALNVLEAGDRAWVEAQITADPDCALELAELEEIVATLLYAPPQISPDPNLKNRLFQRIGRDLPAPPAIAPPATQFPNAIARLLEQITTPVPNGDTLHYSDIRWKPASIPGVMVTTLHIDVTTQETVGLLKAEPGVRYPLHRHAEVEEIFMLQGDLIVGNRVYGSGDYLRSVPGSVHAPETHGGCMFFFRASLNNEILEEQ